MEVLSRGPLQKLKGRLHSPVSYRLPVGDQQLPLNDFLEKPIRLRFSGQINCVHCSRPTNKSFQQGYCYPCFRSLAQCDTCIIQPEKCHHAQGTCREPEWGEEFCMQDHIVYLANSSGVKVGITRATQVPGRWIDQGAVQGLAIMRVRSRLQCGSLEVVLRQHVADKTNWRDMLKSCDHETDLLAEKQRLLEACANEISELEKRFGFHALTVLNGVDAVRIDYPVIAYPTKVSSLNPEKDALVEGTLLGIKGQYLMLDTGVINMRRYSGYDVEFSA